MLATMTIERQIAFAAGAKIEIRLARLPAQSTTRRPKGSQDSLNAGVYVDSDIHTRLTALQWPTNTPRPAASMELPAERSD